MKHGRPLAKGVVVIATTTTLISHGQIAVDSSLGHPAVTLTPQNGLYDISDRYGKVVGPNLFHSFSDFNVGTGERANFSGPPSVQNILARVTGQSLSRIDGTLSSDIPNVNLLFLNPRGIIFGPNASVSVGGSFSATTASYVALQNGGRFDPVDTQNQLLSSAPPTAFGFDGPFTAPITVHGTHLSVQPQKELSLVGGNLEIRADTAGTEPRKASLTAPGGRINLASAQSKGEFTFSSAPGSLPSLSSAQQGDITVLEATRITGTSISSELSEFYGNGQINVQGKSLRMQNSVLEKDNTLPTQGIGIGISVQDTLTIENQSSILSRSLQAAGQPSSLEVSAKNVILQTSAFIDAQTKKSGDGITLHIQTEHFSIESGAFIRLNNDRESVGNGANLVITADGPNASGQVTLDEGNIFLENFGQGRGPRLAFGADTATFDRSSIYAGNYSSGLGGQLSIASSKSFNLQNGSQIIVDARRDGQVNAPPGTGPAGSISVSAEEIAIEGNSSVAPSGLFAAAGQTGSAVGGTINVDAKKLTLNGEAFISSDGNIGKGGDVGLSVSSLRLSNGAEIVANSAGPAPAGTISVKDAKNIFVDGAGSARPTGFLAQGGSSDYAFGGLIHISADNLTLSGNGKLTDVGPSRIGQSAIISSAGNASARSGNIDLEVTHLNLLAAATIQNVSLGLNGEGGDIRITRNSTVNIRDNSTISTRSTFKKAGDIAIDSSSLIQLDQAALDASGVAGANIFLSAPLITLNHSVLTAHATQGQGGNIRINADLYLPSESLFDASSDLGLPGQVKTPPATLDVATAFLPLESPLLTNTVREVGIGWVKSAISGNTLVGRARFEEAQFGHLKLYLGKPE